MGRTPPTRRLPLTARHAAAPMTRIAVSILIQPFPPSHSFPSPGARAHRPCTLLGFARGISSPSPSPSPLTFSPSLPCPLWRTRIDPAIDARSLALCPLASLPPSLSLLTRQRVHVHSYRYRCPSAARCEMMPGASSNAILVYVNGARHGLEYHSSFCTTLLVVVTIITCKAVSR
ncbi:hypothetical protein B0H14DRAFT_1566810 [Mycena olivaceomarginata]|nr:hypothetical protein B0H14DRAFT_1566810 [Mycena olivaceomarginata]